MRDVALQNLRPSLHLTWCLIRPAPDVTGQDRTIPPGQDSAEGV